MDKRKRLSALLLALLLLTAAASPAQGAGAQNGQLDSAGAAAQAVLQGIENQ